MQLFEDMQSQDEILGWSKWDKFYSPYFILTLSLPMTLSSFSEKKKLIKKIQLPWTDHTFLDSLFPTET